MLILVLLLPLRCEAGEIFLLGGGMQELDSDHTSYSFMGEYREGLAENYAISTHYLNEGHVPRHHRDGFAPVMFWRRENLLDRTLSLSVGAGPYLYADTTTESGEVRNEHRLAAIAGASAIWYTKSRLLLQARVSLVQTSGSMNTVTALVGVGYQLDPPRKTGPLPTPPKHRPRPLDNELTLLAGQTIVNNPGATPSTALAVEYRYGLFPFLDMTGSWLHETGSRVVRRNGITTQLWLVRDFLDDHLGLGIGLGPYFTVGRRSGSDIVDRNLRAFATPMLSFTASLHNFAFDPRLSLRLTMNRLITDFDKDQDVFLAGIGYRF